MQQTAQFYCARYRVPDTMPKRFDVISILGDQIRVFQNVTGYQGEKNPMMYMW